MNKQNLELQIKREKLKIEQSQLNVDRWEKQLKEIKDEPVSAEEWLKVTYWEKNNSEWVYTDVDMAEAFKAGEENQKKRNRPKQTFEQWIFKNERFNKSHAPYTYTDMMECWTARGMSHGWESED